MKVAVVGAGAIGGYLGARLSAAGDEVTFIARGPNLERLRASGVKLIEEDGSEVIARDVRAFQRPAEAGVHDVLLLTLKAHQVGPIAHELHHMCHADTSIVTMQNGIPWWYFHNHGGEYAGRPVRAADPDGIIAQHIDPARVIGSVVYPATQLIAPGVVQVVEGNRFTLGELDGSSTPRVKTLADHLQRARFKVRTTDDIRGEIWLKLWGNLSFNPISALSHATLVDICRYPQTRALAADMMAEAEAIANKLGVRFKLGIERRIAGAEKVGAHKTSMLQDIEQGRPIELEALLGAIVELGALTETPTPHIAAVYAVTSLLDQTLRTQGGTLRIQPSTGESNP
jgi:2-dehydropantoate 2-reductase